MITAPDGTWVYMGIPKTGSTSIHKALQEPPVNGIYSGDQHDIPEFHPGRKVYVSVRNPYTRALSLWAHYHGEVESIDFECFSGRLVSGWKEDWWFENQTHWLRQFPGAIQLRMEEMSIDLPEIFGVINVPHENQTYKQKTMTKSQAETVRAWARPDFSLCGYSEDFREFLE